MRQYLVTGPRPVLDVPTGEVLEADLTADQEKEMVDAGRLQIIPVEYEVIGTREVGGAQPGGFFAAAFTIPQEDALVEAGHIERKATTKKASKAKEA